MPGDGFLYREEISKHKKKDLIYICYPTPSGGGMIKRKKRKAQFIFIIPPAAAGGIIKHKKRSTPTKKNIYNHLWPPGQR